MRANATVESKALKKQANKEVYEGLQSNFQVALVEADFVKENILYNVVEGKPLDIEIPKLRNKYNNMKKQWRTAVDREKSGSGLHVEREPKWFHILQPVLSYTSSRLDEISSGPLDTSLVMIFVLSNSTTRFSYKKKNVAPTNQLG